MRAILAAIIMAVLCGATFAIDADKSTAELLGFEPTDRVLIVHADDLGMSHATNVAVLDAFENGVLTSASIMMPTAWVKEVALWVKDHPDADIGVHLTHTSEWSRYRWAPIAGRAAVPGLLAPDGYIWGECEEVWANATPEEAEIEGRAQIDYAIKLGINPTHIDSHMGTMQLNEDFWKVYMKLAVDYNLPQRQASAELYNLMGATGRKEKERAAGVLGPDHLIHGLPMPKDAGDMADFYNGILRRLKPGITELYLHPAIDGVEMQAISGTHARRDADYRWLIDPNTRKLIEQLDIKLIGYREIMDAMRALKQ